MGSFYKGYGLVFLASSLAMGQTGSFTTSLLPSSVSSSDDSQPIAGKQRLQWVILRTVGPESLAGGLFSGGWGTLVSVPKEYGPHWQGFGDRYGMRLTGVAVSNATEAGLGAIWGEDPRYIRDAEGPFRNRLGHVFKMTFMAQNRGGNIMPAYARYIAIPGSNFLSNSWRADSESTLGRASLRTVLGFLGRMSSNTFEEFWPDIRQKAFHRRPNFEATHVSTR